MTPTIHATLLALATLIALAFAGIVLARNPQSAAARMHAIYGGCAAWWFFCMAMIARSGPQGDLEFWAYVVHVGLGLLPGVIYHLNAETSGLAYLVRDRIRLHYAVSIVLVLACLINPQLFQAPIEYAWGPYPHYTAWGLLPSVILAVTFIEAILLYRRALRATTIGRAHKQKLRAFYHGNMLASLALIDFLPVFGIGIYPFGFILMSVMHVATAFGTIRYRLIEITPEFAAAQIFDAIPDGVIAVDSQGLVRAINAVAATMLKPSHNAASLIDQPLKNIAPAELMAIIAADEPPRDINLAFGSSADYASVSVSALPMRDQRSDQIGTLWLLHDLTRQRQAEQKNVELEGWVRKSQKLETLGVMAGGVAHDFNNLLTVILGSADLVKDTLSEAKLNPQDALNIIIAAERATELTTQMLTYSGQAASTPSPLNVNALCREIAELLQSAVSKKATFESQFSKNLPMVVADRGQLSQVILNLITNASDALGDEVGRITLRTDLIEVATSDHESTQHVIIEVSDTGSGMDAQTTARIFDPFYTTKFAGRGLGLANVIGIIESHGGRIKVASEIGRGTTFTVALPAASAVAIEKLHLELPPDKVSPGTALLVDDEPEVRRITQRMLERLGYRVLDATNGREALEVFATHGQDVCVVLLDMTMPEMDGATTHRELRRDNATLPIVLMSGYADTTTSNTPHDDYTTYIKKPFRYELLDAEVRRVRADDHKAVV
jgi:signal transduction histidine kinase/CheY-like chemotaxis protein